MSDTRFGAEVHYDADSQTSTIEMRGDINILAETALNAAYMAAVDGSDPVRIMLDFAHVSYINSTGIALIVNLLTRAREERRAVSARGLSDHFREVFEITRLSDFMHILRDEKGAGSR